MENTLSVVADFCGILAFLISLFVAGTVYKINNRISNSNNNNTSVGISGRTHVVGDFTGRDKKI